MKRYLLFTFLLMSLVLSSQQVSFKRSYLKGESATITTFTELSSLDIVLTYSVISYDITHTGPHTIELHLMKVDKNGNEIWDKTIRKDTTSYTANRFCTQNIDEKKDGTLVLDLIYPYGEKYILVFDKNGNPLSESYLHNTFGDYNIQNQLLKQRGKNLALQDGSILSIGASFTTVKPKATLSIIDAASKIPFDFVYYRGYFNDGFYLNSEHLYTVGVEQSDSNETLVFSDLKNDGMVNFHIKKPHNRNEKIVAADLFYGSTKIRVAESISKKDTEFYVHVYDYDHQGMLLSSTTYNLNCAATTINLDNLEIDWALSNRCKSEQSQTIEKMNANAELAFSFSDSFDSVTSLRKIHDGNYLFCFTKAGAINLWKLNAKGNMQSGTAAEGFFAPNPAKDWVTFIGTKETFNQSAKVKLYDLTGNLLRTYSFGALEPITLHMGGLREAIYIYTILTSDGVELKGKLVVNQKY